MVIIFTLGDGRNNIRLYFGLSDNELMIMVECGLQNQTPVDAVAYENVK